MHDKSGDGGWVERLCSGKSSDTMLAQCGLQLEAGRCGGGGGGIQPHLPLRSLGPEYGTLGRCPNPSKAGPRCLPSLGGSQGPWKASGGASGRKDA